MKGGFSPTPLLVRTLAIAKRTVPPLAAIALAVFAISKLIKRAKEKQIRDFQTQLQSFSSMLNLDTPIDPSSDHQSDSSNKVSPSTPKRFKFRADSKKTDNEIASKVRLDLFRAGGNSGSSSSDASPPPVIHVPDVVPVSPFEKAIAECVAKAEGGDEAAKNAASEKLSKARDEANLNQVEASAVFDAYLSKVVSMKIDRAALNLDSDDRESLKNLHQLAITMSAGKALGPEASLKYVGAHAEQETVREELFRRYAVFCLSSEERVKDDLHGLDDMQRLLDISDERAETINTEIAKGMFQVAVSAAMADGGLNEEDREALDRLKDSFGGLLDGGSAESITSEVAVMRAMYSLQQLLQEQGVTPDDVRELRKMCGELGVDIDEMLQSADALGDALGPEAKEFVESLTAILSDIPPDGDSTVVTSAVKAVDAAQSSTSGEGTS